MKAYAILDGGGVKGAALAGCLQAAAEHEIDFEGWLGQQPQHGGGANRHGMG